MFRIGVGVSIEEKIYCELIRESGFISTKVLASRLELSSDRALRGKSDGPGLLDRASAYIFKKYGKVIVVRMCSPSGVKLSDDVEEIRSARNQWANHHWKIADRVTFYDGVLKTMKVESMKSNQIGMFNGDGK